MSLTPLQIGILQEIAANKISLDEVGEWMRDQLADLAMRDPMLIDAVGPSVFLTEAGERILACYN
jgi:hypothetical protein